MSVTSVNELPDSPSGELNEDTHSFTRKFQVVTDSLNDGVLAVTLAVGIPPLGSTYAFGGSETHLYARVRNISAERVQPNSKIWHVEVRYETKGEEDEDEQDNPLLSLPEIRTSFEQIEEVVQGELDGTAKSDFSDAILNSAGETFDPPPTRQVSNLVLTITRNENVAANHPAIAQEYVDTVSSGAFFGQPARTARMVGISVDRQVKQLDDGTVTAYLKTTYTVHFRDTWRLSLLDHGTYFINDNQEKESFVDAAGHPYLGLLDGAGGSLDSTADPVFLTPKKIYLEKDWSALSLPSSFAEGK